MRGIGQQAQKNQTAVIATTLLYQKSNGKTTYLLAQFAQYFYGR